MAEVVVGARARRRRVAATTRPSEMTTPRSATDSALRTFCSTSSTVRPVLVAQAPQQRHDLRGDPRREAERRLVEQQQARPARPGPGRARASAARRRRAGGPALLGAGRAARRARRPRRWHAGRRPGPCATGRRAAGSPRRSARRSRRGPPGTWAMPRRTSSSIAAPRRSLPSKRDLAGGGGPSWPESVRSRVVLPAPLAPRTATMVPGSTVEVDVVQHRLRRRSRRVRPRDLDAAARLIGRAPVDLGAEVGLGRPRGRPGSRRACRDAMTLPKSSTTSSSQTAMTRSTWCSTSITEQSPPVAGQGPRISAASSLDVVGAQAAGRLVEQQQPRPGDQSPGERDPLRDGIRQRRGRGVGRRRRGRARSSSGHGRGAQSSRSSRSVRGRAEQRRGNAVPAPSRSRPIMTFSTHGEARRRGRGPAGCGRCRGRRAGAAPAAAAAPSSGERAADRHG